MDLKKERTFETDKTLQPGWSKAQLTSADFIPQDGDSIERITTLGVKLTNPYLIPNMQQAYTNLGLSSSLATITNKYVRFKPTVTQLATLDSTMDAQGLELFDTPVDYIVTYEGDYYQDPFIADSLPTWQYAVVPTNFVFPSGITYEVLAQIHIPGDSYTAIETEAERLASLQDSLNGNSSSAIGLNGSVSPNSADDCPPCYVWDAIARKCVRQGQGCGTNPPPPAADAIVPKGCITVTDNNLGTFPGIRQIRIVAKRWFKIERTYTNDQGCFFLTKRFKNKVKIVSKFKNQYCNIRGIRGIRLWQSIYVITRTLGIYSGNQNNITYNFDRLNTSSNQKGNRYWVAATANNAVLEHRDYSTQFTFSPPPLSLNIYITNWGIQAGLASTPLFGKRYWANFPASFVNTFLVGSAINAIPQVGWYVSFFATTARTRLDMAVDYHIADMCRFSSDYIKETFYHELSHASHYSKAGTTWYTNFVNAELNETAAHPGANDPLNPYGASSTGDAPIIALGEGWAYFMGHFLANLRYGNVARPQTEQAGGTTWTSTAYPVCINQTGNSTAPHADVLENFNPNLGADPFRWIPQGLMWDMMDNTPTEVNININDQVSGFSIASIFNSLQSDVTTVPQYRTRFIQQNPGNQTTALTTLFSSYHY